MFELHTYRKIAMLVVYVYSLASNEKNSLLVLVYGFVFHITRQFQHGHIKLSFKNGTWATVVFTDSLNIMQDTLNAVFAVIF